MARWLLADLLTGKRILDLPALSGSWSVILNGAGSIEVTVNLEDPDTRALVLRNTSAPAKTILAVEEHGVLMEAGPIWARSYDRDSATLRLSAKGVWSYFDHRHVLPIAARTIPVSQFVVPDPSDAQGKKTMPNPALQTKLTGLWLGTIFKRLVQQAAAWPNGALPIVLPADETGVHERIYEGAEFKKVGEAGRQLTQVEGGPDVRFRPRRTADALGVEWAMEHGTSAQPLLASTSIQTWNLTAPESGITKLVVDEDSTATSSVAWAAGGRSEDTVLVARDEDSTLPNLGYPLFEVLDSSHSDVVDQTVLDLYANEANNYGRGPVQVWSFEAEIEGQPIFGSYAVGDFVDLVVGEPVPGYTLPPIVEGGAPLVVPEQVRDPYLTPGVYRQRIVSMAGNANSLTVQIQCAPGR